MNALWAAFLGQDIALPILSSLATGVVIGFERELRAKPAGLRTHALVCFASTILMLAAARQAEWEVDFIPGGTIVTDPTRMAHGVLTGIGFLCAGVIFREGATIHGLTTAASLWMTSAIGLLYGVGLYWLAVTGALATLAVLVLLRLFNLLLPDQIGMRLKVAAEIGKGFDASRLRDLLGEIGVPGETISHSMVDGRLEFATRARLRSDGEIDGLAQALSAEPGVVGFSIVPAEDDPEFYRAGRV